MRPEMIECLRLRIKFLEYNRRLKILSRNHQPARNTLADRQTNLYQNLPLV